MTVDGELNFEAHRLFDALMNIFKSIFGFFRRNEPALTLIQRHEIADASVQEFAGILRTVRLRRRDHR
jgi:hypothetical protein